MEKIRIDILGQEYTVVSDESPKYVRSLASRLASHISTVLENATVPQNAAMALVAISYLDELEKSAAEIEKLKAEKVTCENEIVELRSQIYELKETLAKAEPKSDAKTQVNIQPQTQPQKTDFDGAQLKLI